MNKFFNYPFFLMFVFFMALNSGGVYFLTGEYAKDAAKFLVLFTVIIIFWMNRGGKVINYFLAIYFFVVLTLCVSRMFDSANLGYAIEKTDAITFGVLVPVSVFLISCKKFGIEKTILNFLKVGALIVFLTFLFKLKFGFFDRNGRFLFNGANVFGWISGCWTITACFLYSRTKKLFLLLLGLIFFSCVIWSGSKGALISTLLCLFFMMYIKEFSFKKYLSLSAIIAFLYLTYSDFIDLLNEYTPNSRFLAIFRIFQGTTEEVDEGSVEVRKELVKDAINAFVQHPFTGIGLGNFDQYSFWGFFYPHNAHLEVFAEMGVLIGTLYLFFIGFCILRAQFYFSIVGVFFLIASTFSGDISYLRFAFVFLLIGISLRKFNFSQRNYSSERRAS